MTSPMKPAIVATALRKSYGDKVVLDGIDLMITEGTIFAAWPDAVPAWRGPARDRLRIADVAVSGRSDAAMSRIWSRSRPSCRLAPRAVLHDAWCAAHCAHRTKGGPGYDERDAAHEAGARGAASGGVGRVRRAAPGRAWVRDGALDTSNVIDNKALGVAVPGAGCSPKRSVMSPASGSRPNPGLDHGGVATLLMLSLTSSPVADRS
ncbi:hypothetical protein AB0B10_16870 [Micromonospora arborensis]|uniref:hypothetical protein n=1 Tax=Micromonospora arborensis TaxID=2116518 RepID=UPI0033C5991D